MSRNISKPSSSSNKFYVLNHLRQQEEVHTKITYICQVFDLVPKVFESSWVKVQVHKICMNNQLNKMYDCKKHFLKILMRNE